jgi:Fe2+ or Zn2+ uptake regulation protein
MNCGKVVAFEESKELETDIHDLGTQLGFKLTSHSLELRGICPECQK